MEMEMEDVLDGLSESLSVEAQAMATVRGMVELLATATAT